MSSLSYFGARLERWIKGKRVGLGYTSIEALSSPLKVVIEDMSYSQQWHPSVRA